MSDTQHEDEVLVPIAYYGCASYVRRAVDSVLAQTHRNIRVVVINDGDPNPPWPALEDIEDPRLWRVDLTENRGCYFAVEAARRSAASPFLLIQDADDWSERTRISRLLRMARTANTGAACSGQEVHYLSGPDYRPDGLPAAMREEEFSDRVSRKPSSVLRFRCMHHGLFRTDFLHRIGGYYGGVRVSYDTLVIGLAHLLGELTYTSDRLYHRVCRRGSLMTDPKTALGSTYRQSVNSRLADIYAEVFAALDGNRPAGFEPRSIVHRHTAADGDAQLSSCAEQIARFTKTASRDIGVVEV